MTQITPALLAAAYASITVPNAPRAADLSIIGLAAADIPPITTADTAFSNVPRLGVPTMGPAMLSATSQAAASLGIKNHTAAFSGGGSTAATYLAMMIDTYA
ncbi:MAG TPA: hypothetical protein VIN59_01515 [Alphaproteobacteria bacterium]